MRPTGDFVIVGFNGPPYNCSTKGLKCDRFLIIDTNHRYSDYITCIRQKILSYIMIVCNNLHELVSTKILIQSCIYIHILSSIATTWYIYTCIYIYIYYIIIWVFLHRTMCGGSAVSAE